MLNHIKKQLKSAKRLFGPNYIGEDKPDVLEKLDF
jgi:hypothetical protein